MAFSIDHIVIASDDLDVAIRNARSAGFTVVPGGVHGSGHTQNALIGFADGTYLELFAPTPQGRHAEHRWFERIRQGGGLVDFCLRGADLKVEVARMRERGIQYSPPFAMTRSTPEGARIEWFLSTPRGPKAQTGWPFMIEDVTPRAMRVPHAEEQVGHRNGSRGVAGVVVLVRDIDASGEAYEAILGTQAQPATGRDAGCSRHFVVAGAWIQLRQPTSTEEQEHLERHGDGPYLLALRSAAGVAGSDPECLLDPELFCGARIVIAKQREVGLAPPAPSRR